MSTGPQRPTSEAGAPTHGVELEYSRHHNKQLYEISKLVARFESVQGTVPEVLALATNMLHVRIAILVEGIEGRTVTSVWRASSVRQDELEDATKQARTAYAYLVGS